MKIFLHDGEFNSITAKKHFERQRGALFVHQRRNGAVHFPLVRFTSKVDHEDGGHHDGVFVNSFGDIAESDEVFQ